MAHTPANPKYNAMGSTVYWYTQYDTSRHKAEQPYHTAKTYTQSRRLELDQYLSSTYEIRQTSRSTFCDDRSTLRGAEPYYTAKNILRSHLGLLA